MYSTYLKKTVELHTRRHGYVCHSTTPKNQISSGTHFLYVKRKPLWGLPLCTDLFLDPAEGHFYSRFFVPPSCPVVWASPSENCPSKMAAAICSNRSWPHYSLKKKINKFNLFSFNSFWNVITQSVWSCFTVPRIFLSYI